MVIGPATIVVLLGVGLLLFVGALLARGGRCKQPRSAPIVEPRRAACDHCGERLRDAGHYCPRCGHKMDSL